ncbi:MAG: flavodoxin domain-containing protein [Myxococcales bacterium]|jgi:menaquinone-dependent protoporphyrinogen oxidase
MAQRRILILYATSHGHTGKVAERLAGQLRLRGYPVDLRQIGKLERDFSLSRYDAVLVGGSVYARRFQRPLRRFVAANKAQLERMPAAFFAVSLAAASRKPRELRIAREDVERFVIDTGWRPPSVGYIGGAVSYTSYNPLTKLLMRLVFRSLGATDTSRDYVFTDWLAVQHFADGFADLLEELPTPPEQPWVPPSISPHRPHA